MTRARAASLGAKIESCPKRIELAVSRTASIARVHARTASVTHELETELLRREIDLVRPRWYERPAIVGIASVALSVLVLWVATEVLDARRPIVLP